MAEHGFSGGAPDIDPVDLRSRYDRDGFVHLPHLLDPDACRDLANRLETVPEREPGPNPLTLGTMRFRSNLFYASPDLQDLLSSEALAQVVVPLIGPDAWVRWDQAVWKHPGAPPFPRHQDNGYTGLTSSHLQIWIALTPADASNGGLVVVPGAHRSDLPHHWEGHHVVTETPADQPEHQIVAAVGDVIAFSSRLPHETTPNETDSVRLAYVAEYLPLADADPSVPAPHFVAFRGGRPDGAFVANAPGAHPLDQPGPPVGSPDARH